MMKQKTVWLLCAILWTVLTVFRIVTSPSTLVIGYHIAAAVVFWGLFGAQSYCDTKGERGKKLMKRIDILALAVVIVLTIMVFLQ